MFHSQNGRSLTKKKNSVTSFDNSFELIINLGVYGDGVWQQPRVAKQVTSVSDGFGFVTRYALLGNRTSWIQPTTQAPNVYKP